MGNCSSLPSEASTRLPPFRAAAESLIFNAHGYRSGAADASDDAKKLETAWVEGDMLFGKGMINDKAQLWRTVAPMSALKRAGVQLKGDLTLTAVASGDRQPVSR